MILHPSIVWGELIIEVNLKLVQKLFVQCLQILFRYSLLFGMKYCKISSIQPEDHQDVMDLQDFSQDQPLIPQLTNQASSVRQEQVYRKQIEQNALEISKPLSSVGNYFEVQSDLTEHMRGVLLNWLVEVVQKYKLMDETFYLTVKIIDSFLRVELLLRGKLQLLGITALWIAAKYQQTYQVPKVQNLVYICDNAYAIEDILLMEGRILLAVGFQTLSNPPPLFYFQLLNNHAQLTEKDCWLAKYLLEAAVFQLSFQQYSPATIAFSLVFFIKKLRGDSTLREQRMLSDWKVGQGELKTVIRDICRLWQRAGQLESLTSLRKKYSQKQYMEVSKIRLAERIK